MSCAAGVRIGGRSTEHGARSTEVRHGERVVGQPGGTESVRKWVVGADLDDGERPE
jgi:hypothetical protein